MKMRSAMCVLSAAFLVAALVFLVSSKRIVSSAPLGPTVAKNWIGGNEGYWNVAGNWSPSGIPGASDDVTIGSGNTITYTGATSTVKSVDCDGALIIAGGALTVTNSSSLNSLEVRGASAFFDGDTTVSAFQLLGNASVEGVLGGSGTITITDEFHWYGASSPLHGQRANARIIGPGKIVIAASVTSAGMVASYDPTAGEATLGGASPGSGRTLEIYGRLVQAGCLQLASNSLIDIKPGGWIERGGTCWIGGVGTITNNGRFEVIGAGTIQVPFINNGLIDVLDYGELNLFYLTNNGTLRGIPNSYIKLLGYPNEGFALTMPPGSIVTVTQGTVAFVEGFWNIQGTYNVGSTLLDNQANVITMTAASNLQMTNLDVESGKLVLQKNVTLNNLKLQQKYELEHPASLSGNGNITVNGLFNWSGTYSGGLMEGPGSTTVNGTVNINSAGVKILGSPGKPRNLYLNGTGTWSGGDIDASSGSAVTLNTSHSLTARGVLTGTLTNNGTLSVGGSAGTLKITNGYNQGATGALNMELGGNNPGEYDQLQVGGTATLAGTLNVSEINGYSLAGNNLDILTYGSRSGSFNTLNLPPGGQVNYNPHALNVSGVGSAPTSVSIIGASNGTINLSYPFTATVVPVGLSPAPSYVWSPAPDSGQGTNLATYRWATPGGKTIQVTASNSFGSVSDTHDISIIDLPITGLNAENDSPNLLGETTILTASISTGTNVSYVWDFGDTSALTYVAQTYHDYPFPGTYYAVVTATNTAGSAVTSTQVTIWGTLPTAGGTINPAENVTVTLPGGAITDTIVLQFELIPDMSVPGMSDVGVFYQLGPVYQANGLPANLVSGTTYTITVSYLEANIPSGVDENSLALYYWDGSAWVKEPTSLVNVVANTIRATPNHFSQWAILTQDILQLYLSIVRRQ